MGLFGFPRRTRPTDFPPLPEQAWLEASRYRPALRALAPEDALRLRSLASWFLSTREFSPSGGAAPTEADLASIALLACLPVLRLDAAWWFRGWSTLVLVHESFTSRMESVDRAGVVTEYDDELSGQVTGMGPVLLSLQDVRESGLGDGYDVVVHEVAHKLDGREGELDGCPPLRRGMSGSAWRESFSEAFLDFRGRVDRASRGGRRRGAAGRLPLDEYAAESPEEFFAVACEHFFHTPRRLEQAYPAVHARLSEFFIAPES